MIACGAVETMVIGLSASFTALGTFALLWRWAR